MTPRRTIFGLAALFYGYVYAASAITVTLSPATPAPLPIGAIGTYTASAAEAGSGQVWYRFRVRPASGEFRLVRDFAPSPTFTWTTLDPEGVQEIEVTARTSASATSASAIVRQEFTSLLKDGSAAVTPTPNPLVWIFSAPPCPQGSIVFAEYTGAGGLPQVSSPRNCNGQTSENVYLAGMLKDHDYTAHAIVQKDGVNTPGNTLSFHTGTVDEDELGIPIRNVSVPMSAPLYERVIVHSPIGARPYATDTNGNLIWYYPTIVGFLGRPSLGGTFTAINWTTKPVRSDQIAREFDVAGTTIWETNAAIMSDRLQARGLPPTSGFHHEAFRLPSGYILLLAGVEKRIPGLDNKNVMGDMIIVVDNDMNIVWTWNSFDHLDPRQQPILGEACMNSGSCAPVYDGASASDWLHTNSVQYTADGNLLLSLRHLDQIIKIDYRNRQGTGAILWHLGVGGDFQIDSTDAYPWFSHQHDVGFLPGSDMYLMVFDNGNTRQSLDSSAHSRGQIYQLDQTAKTARLFLNKDLGGFSFALGSAQKLRNGNFHFNSGWTADLGGQPTSTAIEVDPEGKIVYSLQSGAAAYRSFRMEDIFTP